MPLLESRKFIWRFRSLSVLSSVESLPIIGQFRIANRTASGNLGMHTSPGSRWQSAVAMLVSLAGMLAASASFAESHDGAETGSSATVSAVDLRPSLDKWGVQSRSQGSRGTCSVFTVTAAIEYALAKSGRPRNCLSVEFLNWASNQAVGESQDGSFFSDLWSGFESYGVCSETEMPYRPKFDPHRKPSPEALADAKQTRDTNLVLHWIKPWDPDKGLNEEQFAAVKATLQAGWPVCGGFLWPKEAQWTDGVLGWAPREGVRDGHSVLLYGFRDDPTQPGGGVFLIRNSSKGPRHGAMTYRHARAYMNDAVWVECVPTAE